MDCPLCETPMTRDLRYTLQDAYRCEACGYQARTPRGYMQAALRKCSNAACRAPLPPDAMGRPRRFCSSPCRQAMYRLRLRSGGTAEVLE